MHNPGEDVTLYYGLIGLLAKYGYESFFCQMTNVYSHDTDIYREFNRIIELCIQDLDTQKYVKSHKLHLIGHFIAGSRILNYCVKGRFKHRIKSIISINPFISPQKGFDSVVSYTTTSFIALMSPVSQSIGIPIRYEHITTNQEWLQYLKEKNYNFAKINAKYLKEIHHISHVLRNGRKYRDFYVKNVLLVRSGQDPISKSDGIEYFAKNCPSENIELLKYEDGANNLFLEQEDVFKKLFVDLKSWLDKN